jgi:hypothetical protein
MTQLSDKMMATESGRHSLFIHRLLYSHGDKIEAMKGTAGQSAKKELLDIADYLEKICFKELDEEVKKDFGWIDDLRGHQPKQKG